MQIGFYQLYNLDGTPSNYEITIDNKVMNNGTLNANNLVATLEEFVQSPIDYFSIDNKFYAIDEWYTRHNYYLLFTFCIDSYCQLIPYIKKSYPEVLI